MRNHVRGNLPTRQKRGAKSEIYTEVERRNQADSGREKNSKRNSKTLWIERPVCGALDAQVKVPQTRGLCTHTKPRLLKCTTKVKQFITRSNFWRPVQQLGGYYLTNPGWHIHGPISQRYLTILTGKRKSASIQRQNNLKSDNVACFCGIG